MCALESGEGRPKFSGVSIGFSLSETRDGWMGICGYYRFILWVIHTLENCSITGHTYWIYSRHTYIYLFLIGTFTGSIPVGTLFGSIQDILFYRIAATTIDLFPKLI